MDLSTDLPTFIMVERKHGFSVDIIFENLHPTCGHSGLIGHITNKYRRLKDHNEVLEKRDKAHQRGRSRTWQVYRPKPYVP